MGKTSILKFLIQELEKSEREQLQIQLNYETPQGFMKAIKDPDKMPHNKFLFLESFLKRKYKANKLDSAWLKSSAVKTIISMHS